ncbi:PepSY domain-containing protein, partial [Steroidobacter sp.]|uniref:PepSY domain-containing protein n=1 Tax=Steroidobacter sp. TaxID=1978227 RepID=UPI001A40976D
ETPESRSSRETAKMWLHGLHEGVALGAIGQWLVTAIGIVPLVLLWTGLRSWSRRRAVRIQSTPSA